MGTIIVGIIVFSIISLALRSIIKNKKRSSCGGECTSCGCHCHR